MQAWRRRTLQGETRGATVLEVGAWQDGGAREANGPRGGLPRVGEKSGIALLHARPEIESWERRKALDGFSLEE